MRISDWSSDVCSSDLWDGDTAAQFRKNMVLPLFNQYLKDGPPANLPAAAIYNTGENHWDRFGTWPLACASGCAAPLTPIYVGPEGSLGFDKPAAGSTSYISDPAKPVPHLSRPVNFRDGGGGDCDRKGVVWGKRVAVR